jgi:DNA-binding transcriptional regulator YhcF (GntR family)
MARFDGGWVKAWRKVAGSDLVDNIYVWGLWHWLLYSAAYKPSKKLVNGRQFEIKPGMVVFGLKELAEKWGCSRSTLQKWVNYLADTSRIVIESRTGGYIVTICNWELYQAQVEEARTDVEQGVNGARTTREREPTLNEEVQEGKKVRERVSIEHVAEAIEAWGKTLARYKIEKDPKLDEVVITRLVIQHGAKKARLALLGAGFEEKSKDYDPGNHCRITRLEKREIFDKFVNLGAKHAPKVREIADEESA